MTASNAIRSTFDEFAKGIGGRNKAGTWYAAGTDAIAVLNLQKSNYGAKYYINLGLWFIGAGPLIDPKPAQCHLQTRAEALVDDAFRPRLEQLLDLENDLSDQQRREILLKALNEQVRPFIDAGREMEGLRSSIGQRLLSKSLLDGDGQRFLEQAGVRR